jgi:hypothetical protein
MCEIGKQTRCGLISGTSALSAVNGSQKRNKRRISFESPPFVSNESTAMRDGNSPVGSRVAINTNYTSLPSYTSSPNTTEVQRSPLRLPLAVFVPFLPAVFVPPPVVRWEQLVL